MEYWSVGLMIDTLSLLHGSGIQANKIELVGA
jgi:hypothetical protein